MVYHSPTGPVKRVLRPLLAHTFSWAVILDLGALCTLKVWRRCTWSPCWSIRPLFARYLNRWCWGPCGKQRGEVSLERSSLLAEVPAPRQRTVTLGQRTAPGHSHRATKLGAILRELKPWPRIKQCRTALKMSALSPGLGTKGGHSKTSFKTTRPSFLMFCLSVVLFIHSFFQRRVWFLLHVNSQ